MEENSRGEKGSFYSPEPQAVWKPVLQQAKTRSLFLSLVDERKSMLTSSQQRAVNIRKWSLTVVDALDTLNRGTADEVEPLDPVVKESAERDFRMGMHLLSLLLPKPTPEDGPLDTPFKLAKHVAVQLLEAEGKSIDQESLTIIARHYLFADFGGRKEPEFPLKKDVVWDESRKLWDTLVGIVLSDPELSDQIPRWYLRAITQEDKVPDLGFEIRKTYPRRNGSGSFRLNINSGGIDIEERDEREEYLGGAFVLGPGNTDGYIGFTEPNIKNDDHTNTDVALREVKRIVASLKRNLS
jgi:hypothetical protein